MDKRLLTIRWRIFLFASRFFEAVFLFVRECTYVTWLVDGKILVCGESRFDFTDEFIFFSRNVRAVRKSFDFVPTRTTWTNWPPISCDPTIYACRYVLKLRTFPSSDCRSDEIEDWWQARLIFWISRVWLADWVYFLWWYLFWEGLLLP